MIAMMGMVDPCQKLGGWQIGGAGAGGHAASTAHSQPWWQQKHPFKWGWQLLLADGKDGNCWLLSKVSSKDPLKMNLLTWISGTCLYAIYCLKKVILMMMHCWGEQLFSFVGKKVKECTIIVTLMSLNEVHRWGPPMRPFYNISSNSNSNSKVMIKI